MSVIPERLRSALSHRYPIEREIGRGGMAIVYLAHDLKHDRPVALKVFHREYASGLGVDRFLREIRIAAQMTHSHILPLYDSDATEGFLYYVMPYVPGGTLRDRLSRETQLPVEDAIQIARQVADALSHAHSQNVIHRDIKPANILLEKGTARVADFGIARAVTVATTVKTESGVVVGTPHYMSPEQASGESDLDGRSDIYSLGCVLYEMVAGRPPFTGKTAREVLARHIMEPPPPIQELRPQVPVWLERIIEKALAKARSDRFASAELVSKALATHTAPDPKRGRRFRIMARRIAIALGVGVIATYALMKSIAPPNNGDIPRIAVLYLDDRSADRTLAWLASGLTEELIDRIRAAGSLDVASALGVRPFAGKAIAPDSIGRRLGASTLVSGTIEPMGGNIRVSLHMVDAASGNQLDSFFVDESLDDLRALRTDVADMLARMLRKRLGKRINLARLQNETDSDIAWREVNKALGLRDEARVLLGRNEIEAAAVRFDRADSLFALAEQLDPNWSVPTIERGWLANYRAFLEIRAGDIPADDPNPLAADRLREGLNHSERVLQRHPDDIAALELRGVLNFRLAEVAGASLADSLLTSAYTDLSAVTLRDESRARAWYTLAALHLERGRASESILAAEKALSADVYAEEAGEVLEQLYLAALYDENYADARRWCWFGQRHDPENEDFLECRLYVLGWSAGSDQAVDEAWHLNKRLDSIPKLAAGWPHRRLLIASMLARAGQPDSARALIQQAYDGIPESEWPYLGFMEAYARSALGERDRALRLLSSYLESNPQDKGYVAHHPWFKQLRDQAEFKSLVQQQRSGSSE